MINPASAMIACLTPDDAWVILQALEKITSGYAIELHKRMVDAAYPKAPSGQLSLGLTE